MSGSVEIGVISDTHGLLRPGALEALGGVSTILHAGDVGGAEILAGLETIAPVRAVRGNTDGDAWGRRLPLFELIEIAGVTIYLHHGHLDPEFDFQAAGVSVVICGHSHRPLIETRAGILWLNPGSAGPRRFDLPVTVARLTLRDRVPEARLLTVA